MATQVPCKKNNAAGYIFYVGLVSQANPKNLQANPTLEAGDVKIAIDDGAPANLNTLPVVDADFTKRVKVVLSQAETNGDNITLIFSDQAGAEWCDAMINIQTVANQIDDLDSGIDTAISDIATRAAPGDAMILSGDYDAAKTAAQPGDAMILSGDYDAAKTAAQPGDAMTLSGDYDASKTAAQAGDAMTLTNAYDAAKTASQLTLTDIFGYVVEGTLTFLQIIRIKLAALSGKSTDGGIKFRDLADSKNRINATVDALNNRTAVTLDGT